MKTPPIIELEQGLELIENLGIAKIKRILEGQPEPPFSASDYMTLYTIIYNMSVLQMLPHCYCPQLYEYYKQAFVKYITDTVMPCLREKHDDEYMLRELVRRWSNHKVMVKCLYRFFNILDREYTEYHTPLKEVGLLCFRHLVYNEVRDKAKNAVIALIHVEREGGQIDRAFLKNVVDIFVEIGIGQMEQYENDFESYMLEETSAYYSCKASTWILEDSCPEYMLKSEKCLKNEKDRVSHYLHSSSEQKLLKILQYELLEVYANQLLNKENSGCRSLLRDNKVEDLSRMYRLYEKIFEGIEPIGAMFKQHIIDEGTSLVQQAEDAANNKAGHADDSDPKQVFVMKVIELHDKFMVYINNCFASHAFFHKSLKEAFETFLNTSVAGSSSAELMATFCDNILKKGVSSEALSDEAIEELLEKVVKMFAYLRDKDQIAEFNGKELSRRLLSDKSASDDRERSILVTKFKQQCVVDSSHP